MVSEYEGDWLLVTPVYPMRRGHDEYPGAAADRGRDHGMRDYTALPAAPAAELGRSGATRSRRRQCDGSPVVLPTASYPDLRLWQRRGGKLRGQRNLLPTGRAASA